MELFASRSRVHHHIGRNHHLVGCASRGDIFDDTLRVVDDPYMPDLSRQEDFVRTHKKFMNR